MTSASFSSLKTAAKRFFAAQGGNFAITFALCSVPVAGVVSAAVDYSIMLRVKTELQAAVDGSVLAAANDFTASLETKDLGSTGRDYFDGNFSSTGLVTNISYNLEYGASADTTDDDEVTGLKLTGTATAKYQLQFGKFVGITDTTIRAKAAVNIASATIETAFILDASGSMTDDDAFKKSTKAAHDMLLGLKQYALAMGKATKEATEFARYSLVPFAWGVNVGTDNADADWMDLMGEAEHQHDHADWTQGFPDAVAEGYGWKDDSDWLTRFTLYGALGESWGGCVEARTYPYFLDDTPPDILNPDTLFVPHLYPDEPDNLASGEVDFTNNYLVDNITGESGSIALDDTNSGTETLQIERQQWTSKYNESAKSSDYGKNGVGPNRNCFGHAIHTLSADFGQSNSKIANINVTFSEAHNLGSGDDDGATNIQQGMVWGWRTLSAGEPITDGRADNDVNNRKVAILITDGINSYGTNSSQNESQYGAFGFVSDDRLEGGLSDPSSMTVREMMDEQTLTTCANMKKAGIEIFVVGYGVSASTGEEAMLKKCAGGNFGNQYYFGVDENTIAGAMTGILSQLVDIRLVH